VGQTLSVAPERDATSPRDAWVRRVLGVDIPPRAPAGAAETGSPKGLSLVRLGKARLEWRDTLIAARRDMDKLKAALAQRFAGVDDPKARVPAALDRLARSIAELDDTLLNELDAVLTAGPDDRPPLITRARATMAAYARHILADPVMAALDGNEVLPATLIVGPLKAKLAEIHRSLT
jgi:hypothetical protein